MKLIQLAAIAALLAASGVRAQTVGNASVDIDTTGARVAECRAGNMTADAVRAAVKADLALVPAGALTEATVKAGPVSRDDLAKLLADPEDHISVLALTGAKVMDALERSVNVYDRAWAGFLQVSGIEFTFDASRKSGNRVTSAKVGGAALDTGKTYRVATTHNLAGGGLGYFQIWQNNAIVDTDGTLLDALAAHVKAQGTVAPKLEGRIKK